MPEAKVRCLESLDIAPNVVTIVEALGLAETRECIGNFPELAKRWGSIPQRFEWIYWADPPVEKLWPHLAPFQAANPDATTVDLLAVTHRGDINGYCHMILLKIHELSLGALELLERGWSVAAVAVARSIVEATAYLLRAKDLWEKLLKSQTQQNRTKASEDLENFLRRGGSSGDERRVGSIRLTFSRC